MPGVLACPNELGSNVRQFKAVDDTVFVYRCYDEQCELLYVGVAKSVRARLDQHAKSSTWYCDCDLVTSHRAPDLKSALAEEARAIFEERPKFNKINADKEGAKFSEIGRRIKSLRINSNLTQAEFAKSVGFNVTQYANWEGGVRRPTITAAIVLCDAFDVTLDWIFRGK